MCLQINGILTLILVLSFNNCYDHLSCYAAVYKHIIFDALVIMNTTDCWHAVQLFIPLQKTTQAIMYTTLTISKTSILYGRKI